MTFPINFLKQYFSVLLFFLLNYFILLPFTNNFCHQISHIDFDTQNLFVWDHLDEMGYKPYKDTFYPYGFLYFYKSQHLLWYVLYTLMSPFLLTVVYFTLIDKLFSKTSYKIVVYLSLLTLILNTQGITLFSRYGILGSLALLSAWMLYGHSKQFKWRLIFLGIMSGIVTLFSSGDGLYLFVLQLCLITYDFIIFNNLSFSLKTFSELIKRILFFLLGVFIGLIPLLFLLINQEMLSSFISFYRDMVYISEYAKIRYLIDNVYEVFILISLVIGLISTLILVSSKIFRQNYSTYILVTSCLSFLIIFQKHLIRPLALIILYNAFLIILIIFGIGLTNLSNRKDYFFSKPWILLLTYLTFFIAFTSAFRFSFNYQILKNSISGYTHQNYLKTFDFQSKLCRIDTINWSTLGLPPAYQQIKGYLEAKKEPYSIYSFPYDPLFYLWLSKKPAPYPNVYEAAPLTLQQQDIQFLEEQPVNYVIYNTNALVIDGSPEYLRNHAVTSYILNNFHPVAFFNPYIILKKNEFSSNFYANSNVKSYPELYNNLLNPNWGSLPLTQGKTNSHELLLTADNKYYFTNSDELNHFLAANVSNLENYYLMPHFTETSTTTGNLIALDSNHNQSTLLFNIEPNSNPIFSLKKMPLFMSNGQLKKVDIAPIPEYIWLIQNRDTSRIW